jgi:ATP-binding cassette subfamily B protein
VNAATTRAHNGHFRRAFRYLAPYRGVSLIILILALTGAALSAVEPLAMKYLFDGLQQGNALAVLAAGVGALLFIGLAREALGAWQNLLGWRVRLGVQYDLLDSTVSRLHTLPVSFHRREGVGATMTRLDRGISGFVSAVAELAVSVLPSFSYLVISTFIMFRLEWHLMLVALAFTPIPALISRWAAGEQMHRERVLIDRWARIYSRFNEVLSGIVTVKSFTMEEEEKLRFLREVNATNQVVARGVGVDSGVGAAKNVAAMLARLTVIAIGGVMAMHGHLTVGSLVAFLGYVGGLFGPVQGLTGVYQTLRRATVSLETVFAIIDAEDKLGDRPGAVAVERLRGEVEFRGVGFSYDGVAPILNDVSFTARPGEMIALVGPSGGGKSTAMALLQRLYDPERGEVLVDGMDLRDIRQRSLRRHIGVVLQEALLFEDTIRNNIAYGRPQATLREIEGAARAANAHDFIMKLPDGYDTVVGERGSTLSGGERQRIAIARALLKDPPILILDEATAALDAESEALVQEAVAKLISGRTTFVIAHRLSTVVDADRILVLRAGAIVEAGSHQELMALGGYYARLVGWQTRRLMRVA